MLYRWENHQSKTRTWLDSIQFTAVTATVRLTVTVTVTVTFIVTMKVPAKVTATVTVTARVSPAQLLVSSRFSDIFM